MKFLFLLYACAEKFRAAKIDAINVSLSPKASMAEFHAAKREDAMKFLKFLDARSFGLRAAELLNLTPAPSRNGFKILKFTPELSDGFRNLKFTSVPRNRFGILKFTLALARLADAAQNFVSQNGFKILKLVCEPPHVLRPVLTRVLRCALSRANKVEIEAGRGCSIAEKRRAVKLAHAGGYLNSARRRIARFCSAAARHGYEVGRAENFSKFSLTSALLNFISLSPRKFKLALLKFTLAPHKFKPASAVRLNFALNSAPQARAAKFENGVKFKGAAKFERGAR